MPVRGVPVHSGGCNSFPLASAALCVNKKTAVTPRRAKFVRWPSREINTLVPWTATTSRRTAGQQPVDHETASHPAPHSRCRLHGYVLAEPVIGRIQAAMPKCAADAV